MTWFISNYILIFIFVIGSVSQTDAISSQKRITEPENLKVEYFTNPVGLGSTHPRLSWNIKSNINNTLQTAYQIQVATTMKALQRGKFIWNTGKIDSSKSIQHPYLGPSLKSGQRYYWRVRIWDNHGHRSEWSKVSYWEMGLLHPDDWKASWIEPGFTQDSTKSEPCPMLRSDFKISGKVASARLYVTSHGLYEIHINGQKVGDDLFTPGWTDYNKRLQYQTYDVTDMLKNGDNAIGALLGDGWYRGYLSWFDYRNVYGSKLALLAQIKITYANGSTQVVGTNGNWKSTTGPILKSDIYNGETYDARLQKTGWTKAGYNDKRWDNVKTVNFPKNNLIAPQGPPVRKIEELKPVRVIYTPQGDTVLDMGQNMVGWVRFKVKGKRGIKITLRHAEVLDKHGNFYTANLRSAKATDTYILKGGGEEVFHPHFTFHGFRYVEVKGYPGKLNSDDFTGIVIHSDMEPTGHFESSNPLVNQLQSNIVWGQKGNFLSVPTDCPQRDERLGWTGDAEVFAPTASINMETAGFYTKWLGDMAADQLPNGVIPTVIPYVLRRSETGIAGWSDADVIMPWTVYQAYGDKRVLENQYKSMKAWVDYVRKQANSDNTPYIWDTGRQIGDWLAFSPENATSYQGSYTATDMIATAYFARSTDLLQRTAKILGKKEDAEKYARLLSHIKKAYVHEFVTPGGRVISDTQTAYVLALKFNLLPDSLRKAAVRQLIKDIDARGHLTTGFLGTPQLNPVLSNNGHTDVAYRLLLNKQYPSWLYPITMGATTMWERWDGIKPDSTFETPSMNSFNHYAYGAIGYWLYTVVGGLQKTEPGYKTFTIHPEPGGNMSHARVIFKSMCGKIESSWNLNSKTFDLKVRIPANTQAKIVLPNAQLNDVKINGEALTGNAGMHPVQTGKNVELKLGSGNYDFSYNSSGFVIPSKSEFSIQSPVNKLLGNDQARAVLKKYIPQIINSGRLARAGNRTLQEIARFAPGQLTAGKLKSINEELKQVKSNADRSFSTQNKLGLLLTNRNVRNVLHKEMPELMDSPWLSQVMGFSLERANQVVPNRFRVSESTLTQINQKLARISN